MPAIQNTGFGRTGRGVSLQTRVTSNNFQFHKVRRSDGNRLVIPKDDLEFVLLSQPLLRIGNEILRSRELLEAAVGFHEVIELSIVVEIFHFRFHDISTVETVA